MTVGACLRRRHRFPAYNRATVRLITFAALLHPTSSFVLPGSRLAPTVTRRPHLQSIPSGPALGFKRDNVEPPKTNGRDAWDQEKGVHEDRRPLPTQDEEFKGVGESMSRREFMASKGSYYFDNDTVQKQLQLFWSMAVPYFKEDRGAKMLLGAVILLTLASSGTSVWFSYISRDFWSALSSKDAERFYELMVRFFGALCVGVPINVLYKWQRQRLSLSWREWLTNRIMELYYSNRNYYRLEASGEVDNPDQRIAEDVRAFTKDSLDFFISLLTAAIDLVAFSTILYKIYPQLFVAIILYAGFGTLVTTAIGKRLVGLNFLQLQREAYFRYSLMRVRENSESIAFYGGEGLEMKEIGRRFTRLLDNTRDVIATQRNLEFFTVSYRYLIQVIPGLVVAPLFFVNKIELGVVSQSYSAFNHILSDLSLIVNQFESLSAFSAGIDRLAEFLEKIQGAYGRRPDGEEHDLSTIISSTFIESIRETQRHSRGEVATASPSPSSTSSHRTVKEGEAVALLAQGPAGRHVQSAQLDISGPSDGVEVTIAPGQLLQLEHVTVTTPDGRRTLVTDLSLTLQRGGRLLIVGSSGAGKSSLLRVMAGLWSAGKGKVRRPTVGEMFFLPQKPYCTLGSLRDQLLYPNTRSNDTAPGDDELIAILEAVNLAELPRRVGNGSPLLGLDVVVDWAGTLSLGEQQRLAFGRLLVNRPSVAILDEATSALDLESETKMYALLRNIPDISYVSVGHRPSLMSFHDTKLTLSSEKGFKFEKIDETTAKSASVL